MKTKLLRRLRHEYSDLYNIRYSDAREQWELYTSEDAFDDCYQYLVYSAKELSDVQNHLRKQVQDHIVEYLRAKGRDSLSPNKYLW